MDIAGAKALKRRLGPNGIDEAPPASVDVSEDAPPVYHWVGVDKAPKTTSDPADDAPASSEPSLFSRLGLSSR